LINEIRLQQLSVAGFLEALAAALFLSAPSPSPSQQLSQVGNPSSYQLHKTFLEHPKGRLAHEMHDKKC